MRGIAPVTLACWLAWAQERFFGTSVDIMPSASRRLSAACIAAEPATSGLPDAASHPACAIDGRRCSSSAMGSAARRSLDRVTRRKGAVRQKADCR